MLFRLLLIREKGAVIPKWRACMHRARLGDLHIGDHHDPILNRSTRLARFSDPNTGGTYEGVPPLLDAVLVCVAHGYMTVTGFERLHDPLLNRDFEYAQTWWLSPASDE